MRRQVINLIFAGALIVALITSATMHVYTNPDTLDEQRLVSLYVNDEYVIGPVTDYCIEINTNRVQTLTRYPSCKEVRYFNVKYRPSDKIELRLEQDNDVIIYLPRINTNEK